MSTAKVVQVSVDHHLHNGWSMDYQGLPPVDVLIACEPDVAVPALLDGARPRQAARRSPPTRGAFRSRPATSSPSITSPTALRRAVGDAPTLAHPCLAVVERRELAVPSSARLSSARDGGGGVGGGPGISVGAALALKGCGRLPVAVCGDGDFLMGVTALWTAAHYRIPLLIVVANNRSFFNDELHQERVARMRNRPVENRWIGQRISEPDIDLAAHGARARARKASVRSSRIADLAAVFDEGHRRGRSGRGRGGRCAGRAGLHRRDDRGDDRKSE